MSSLESRKQSLQAKRIEGPETSTSMEVSPIESEKPAEQAGLEAEAAKIEKLGVLDMQAREVAAGDRAQADALLTDMKDGKFTTHRDNRDFLESRVDSARANAAKTQEKLNYQQGQYGSTHFDDPDAIRARKGMEIAMQDLQSATQDLGEYETNKVQPTAESLAHEKNPVAHSNYKDQEAGEIQTFLRTHFPWFPLVWTTPKSALRRDEGRATPGGA